MSIYRVGKYWYIDIYVDGQRLRKSISKVKKRADDVETHLKEKYRLKQFHIDDIRTPVPFSYIAKRYLKYCKDTKSTRTYELELSDYTKHLTHFDDYLLTDISTDKLLDYQSMKKAERYSNRTVNIHIGLIRKIRNYAITYKYINDEKIKYPMLRESKREHAFLQPAEIKKFIQCFSYDLVCKRVIFGFMTGLRPAELTYLAWDDINSEMQFLKVTSKPPLWTIKTDEERIVPLNKTALKIIYSIERKGRWVFSDNDKPVKSIRRAINTAATKAGITRRVTPGMLRHSFATLCLMYGGDIKSVQVILGHQDIKTTMKYTHSIEDQVRKTVDLLELPYIEKNPL